MDRQRLLWGRRCLAVCVCLGALTLGLGLVWWAAMNIAAQSRRSVDVYQSPLAEASATGAGGVVPAGDVPARESESASDTFDVDRGLNADRSDAADAIGSLSMPALDQTLPIFEGTGEDELKRGVGHFSLSVLPGQPDNCVLSGHRDTVFMGLGKLKVGDDLVVRTQAGTFTYEISRIRVVDKDDKTVIVPADHAVLTVTTCYPFNYIGAAPDRYILVADLATDH